MKIYAVGGAVRDRLLGRPVSDRDWVVVGATASGMEALGFRRVGRDFPVFLHPVTHEEYALARRERKVAPGYAGFTFDAGPEVTLEADLLRRDLTINAMAEGEDGTVIDPHGGQADLAARVLRHVSPAFAEDPVRILRTARFAARFDWVVADETLALMRTMVAAGEVDALVAERVWVEWERALGEAYPQRFIEVLMACGALGRIWPELAALMARPDGAGAMALACLRAAVSRSSDASVRAAALLHQVEGDPGDDRGNDATGAHGTARGALERLLERMRAPNDFHDLALLAGHWVVPLANSRGRDPGLVWEALQKADALRRPERFGQLAEVVAARLEAVARADDGCTPAAPVGEAGEAGEAPGATDGMPAGRAEVASARTAASATAGRLTSALAAALRVQARDLAARGLSGPALGEALAQARREAVEDATVEASLQPITERASPGSREGD